MDDAADAFHILTTGPLYHFRDWPNLEVPQVAAGVYTIWRATELVYVGMAGRSLTSDDVIAHRAAGARNKGLFSRLNSHACGRRSGDQFCVYAADRLVLPSLGTDELARIAAGELSFDALIKRFIHEHLSYRFTEVTNGNVARRVEKDIRQGCLAAGQPVLNPLLRIRA